ncbi:MAG: trypsin-like serine protease [Actinomycetia bacterium]|nr:trypsin-like serine protease [Actinomycetes bacterium]MCP4958657.1 trypsin-like serine protease [Actinomycetes bacterium]
MDDWKPPDPNRDQTPEAMTDPWSMLATPAPRPAHDPLPVFAVPLAETPVPAGVSHIRRRRWTTMLGAVAAVTCLMAMSAVVSYLVASNTSPNSEVTAGAPATNTDTTTTIAPFVVPVINSAGIEGEPYAQAAAVVAPAVVQITTQDGVGSGVVYDSSGLVLTAAHVVEGADTVLVLLSDGRKVEGQVVGSHQLSDIGVVSIEAPAGLAVAALADGDQITVGQGAVAVGSPFGLDQTVTAGVVSAVDRIISNIPMVQTDAAINPGNSGGPLVNLDGEVIGISSQIFTESGDNAGVGFAVTIDLARIVAEQLTEGDTVELALLGVLSAPSGDGSPGALIQEVVADSAAAAGGIEVGDIITAIDGLAVRHGADLRAEVLVRRPGSSSTLTVERDGQVLTIEVVFGSTS